MCTYAHFHDLGDKNIYFVYQNNDEDAFLADFGDYGIIEGD